MGSQSFAAIRLPSIVTVAGSVTGCTKYGWLPIHSCGKEEMRSQFRDILNRFVEGRASSFVELVGDR